MYECIYRYLFGMFLFVHGYKQDKISRVIKSRSIKSEIHGTRTICVYRVSQEECARLREKVPYVTVYRYNPKHLYPMLNGYGDNGQRKVGAYCAFKYCNQHS